MIGGGDIHGHYHGGEGEQRATEFKKHVLAHGGEIGNSNRGRGYGFSIPAKKIHGFHGSIKNFFRHGVHYSADTAPSQHSEKAMTSYGPVLKKHGYKHSSQIGNEANYAKTGAAHHYVHLHHNGGWSHHNELEVTGGKNVGNEGGGFGGTAEELNEHLAAVHGGKQSPHSYIARKERISQHSEEGTEQFAEGKGYSVHSFGRVYRSNGASYGPTGSIGGLEAKHIHAHIKNMKEGDSFDVHHNGKRIGGVTKSRNRNAPFDMQTHVDSAVAEHIGQHSQHSEKPTPHITQFSELEVKHVTPERARELAQQTVAILDPKTATQQFAESYHNIETKRFPGHKHYVGYGDGVWHIHKHDNGWRATHKEGKYPPKTANTLKEISEHLGSVRSTQPS